MLEWRAEAHCGRPSFNCYYGTHNCTLLYNIAAHIPQEKTTPLYIQEAQNNSIVVDFPVSFSSFLLPIYLWVFMFFVLFCFVFFTFSPYFTLTTLCPEKFQERHIWECVLAS